MLFYFIKLFFYFDTPNFIFPLHFILFLLKLLHFFFIFVFFYLFTMHDYLLICIIICNKIISLF